MTETQKLKELLIKEQKQGLLDVKFCMSGAVDAEASVEKSAQIVNEAFAQYQRKETTSFQDY
ncbi:Uncharacterised protein [BD1-7 clade bacterium]|uniref:Uncharacterized protein n=1 Tax=BD1-7 clade bacterium TaxID=2029982 RepID=A0A5S9QTP4_9GAMM|nr:Uncharacterised protein [BD1-7 clade bacterium]CAA0122895.1 Uncharacterised protein [BD1-7 clade bacterium]